jgi:hypothetical protein
MVWKHKPPAFLAPLYNKGKAANKKRILNEWKKELKERKGNICRAP